MAKHFAEVRITLSLTNPEAVQSLLEVADLVSEAAENYPWCQELAEATEKLQFCVEELTPEIVMEDDDEHEET